MAIVTLPSGARVDTGFVKGPTGDVSGKVTVTPKGRGTVTSVRSGGKISSVRTPKGSAQIVVSRDGELREQTEQEKALSQLEQVNPKLAVQQRIESKRLAERLEAQEELEQQSQQSKLEQQADLRERLSKRTFNGKSVPLMVVEGKEQEYFKVKPEPKPKESIVAGIGEGIEFYEQTTPFGEGQVIKTTRPRLSQNKVITTLSLIPEPVKVGQEVTAKVTSGQAINTDDVLQPQIKSKSVIIESRFSDQPISTSLQKLNLKEERLKKQSELEQQQFEKLPKQFNPLSFSKATNLIGQVGQGITRQFIEEVKSQPGQEVKEFGIGAVLGAGYQVGRTLIVQGAKRIAPKLAGGPVGTVAGIAELGFFGGLAVVEGSRLAQQSSSPTEFGRRVGSEVSGLLGFATGSSAVGLTQSVVQRQRLLKSTSSEVEGLPLQKKVTSEGAFEIVGESPKIKLQQVGGVRGQASRSRIDLEILGNKESYLISEIAGVKRIKQIDPVSGEVISPSRFEVSPTPTTTQIKSSQPTQPIQIIEPLSSSRGRISDIRSSLTESIKDFNTQQGKLTFGETIKTSTTTTRELNLVQGLKVKGQLQTVAGVRTTGESVYKEKFIPESIIPIKGKLDLKGLSKSSPSDFRSSFKEISNQEIITPSGQFIGRVEKFKFVLQPKIIETVKTKQITEIEGIGFLRLPKPETFELGPLFKSKKGSLLSQVSQPQVIPKSKPSRLSSVEPLKPLEPSIGSELPNIISESLRRALPKITSGTRFTLFSSSQSQQIQQISTRQKSLTDPIIDNLIRPDQIISPVQKPGITSSTLTQTSTITEPNFLPLPKTLGLPSPNQTEVKPPIEPVIEDPNIIIPSLPGQGTGFNLPRISRPKSIKRRKFKYTADIESLVLGEASSVKSQAGFSGTSILGTFSGLERRKQVIPKWTKKQRVKPKGSKKKVVSKKRKTNKKKKLKKRRSAKLPFSTNPLMRTINASEL